MNDIKWVKLYPNILEDAADEYTGWFRVLMFSLGEDRDTWLVGLAIEDSLTEYVPVGYFAWDKFAMVSIAEIQPE